MKKDESDLVMGNFLSSPLAGKRDIVVTILVWCMCVRPCVRASIQICPDQNLYNNAWITKKFGTVVSLEDEKCNLKHFFRWVEGQGHRGQIKVRTVVYRY